MWVEKRGGPAGVMVGDGDWSLPRRGCEAVCEQASLCVCTAGSGQENAPGSNSWEDVLVITSSSK